MSPIVPLRARQAVMVIITCSWSLDLSQNFDITENLGYRGPMAVAQRNKIKLSRLKTDPNEVSGCFSTLLEKVPRGYELKSPVLYRIMCGLSSNTRREHIVKAALEAVCHQTCTVATAMESDCAPLQRLLADGGMAQNSLLMQMQADLLGIPVVSQ